MPGPIYRLLGGEDHNSFVPFSAVQHHLVENIIKENLMFRLDSFSDKINCTIDIDMFVLN